MATENTEKLLTEIISKYVLWYFFGEGIDKILVYVEDVTIQ